jgi:DNA helicase HerA-like ATPase
MTATRRYIRIEPARERVTPSDIISRLAGLRKLKSGWKVKYDPWKNAPTFEFLALTQGSQTPVRFYLGADDETLLSTVRSELTTAYPASYDLSEEALELPHELLGASTGTIDTDNDEDTVESQSIDNARSELVNRTPIAARWQGVGTRTDDWMTPLKQYSQLHATHHGDSASAKAPLATAVERLAKASAPTVLQVLFTRYADWEKAANTRKENIQTKRDGLVQTTKTNVRDLLRGYDEEEIRDRRRGRDAPQIGENIGQSPHTPSGGVASRQTLIDQKNPSQTFLVNMRAAGVLPADATDTTIGTVENEVDALANAFNHLDGSFYELDGSRLTKGLTNIRDPAKKELKRLLDRSLTISNRSRKRPQLILNADELANFVAVPSAHALTTEGARGTRGKERLRQPLSLPAPEMLDRLSAPGMAIGLPLKGRSQPLDDAIHVHRSTLVTHYIRAASTGSGKSKSVQNDILTLSEHVGGPTVLLESKGDAMVDNYLKAHYAKFGTLDNVYHFDAPDMLPAFSFFDIRPALAMGRRREDAIQDTVEHFHEVMRLILGTETHDRAFVANEILTFLIKALFDKEYGQDAFSLDTLIEAVYQMRHERILPEICAENAHIERALLQQCELDETQFQQSMGGAANRLNKLVELEHLYQIFNHVPEWDDEANEYTGNVFDFRHFLDEDAVILFDIGELRADSRNALTMLLLSNLWDAVQGRSDESTTGKEETGASDEKIANVIIEEAAAVATSELVYEEFLPQGRGFGVSLGLIMQYPDQVNDHSRSNRPYKEILNNVKTKIIGNIEVDDELAKSMAHENLSKQDLSKRIQRLPSGEWIVQLPSPGFGETDPTTFSLAPLPIPEGHPESDEPLAGDARHLFEEMARPQVRRRTQTECSIPDRPSKIGHDDARDTLVEMGEEDTADAEAADGGTPTETPFFGGGSVGDDTDTAADGEVPTGIGDTPASDRPSDEQDFGDASMFGAPTTEQSPADDIPNSTSSEQTETGTQNGRSSEGEAGTTDAGEETTDTDNAGDGPDDAALSEHVHYDTETDGYVCDLCGTEYSASEKRRASVCCQFASKDEVFVAARRAHKTTDSTSDLLDRLRKIAAHAEDYGIEISLQEFASLDSPTESVPSEKETSGPRPEPEQTQVLDTTAAGRFSEATTNIPDETLRAEGVTRDEAAFLGIVLDAMNHQFDEYSLTESMADFDEPFSNLDVETLIQKGFLEKHRAFRQTYYTVLPAGRTFLDRSLAVNPGIGDLGEKTPHKAGVVFLEQWLAQYHDVDRTERYYQHDSGTVFDVAGFDASGDLCWVGEVETTSHNTDAVISDYEKLANVDANAAWAFEDRACATDVIDTLIETGPLDLSLTATQKQTVSALRAALSQTAIPGMTAVNTFRSLKTEVDTER